MDGILLALHGAMVTQEHDDGEGYLLRRIRAEVGLKIPIIITLDLHAALTPEMAAYANGIVIMAAWAQP